MLAEKPLSVHLVLKGSALSSFRDPAVTQSVAIRYPGFPGSNRRSLPWEPAPGRGGPTMNFDRFHRRVNTRVGRNAPRRVYVGRGLWPQIPSEPTY